MQPPLGIHSSKVAPLAILAWLALGLLLVSSAARAEAPEMVFARLDSSAGLSQGGVMTIVQDAQGFLWFGTEDGLDRFDGYELRHFSYKSGTVGTLPNNWISALARDAAGRLWVGTDGGGLVWRDSELSRFQPPSAIGGQAIPDPTARVRALYVDRNGRIWVATRNAGVYLLDTARKQSRQFRHQEANPESLSDDSIFALAEDASGQIWIGTQSGLDRLDPDSGRIDHFGARLREAGVPNEAALKVNALYADARGTLWIGMDSGLAKFDAPAGAFTVLRHRAVDPNSLPDGRVTSLLEDDEQRLWVGTSDGLALLDRRTDTCVVLRHDPANPSSLPDNNVVSLYQDRSGQLWIGTKTGGLAHWNPRSWSFGHRRLTEGANNVTSFADDGRGTLWIGSFGAGVAALDSHTGALTRYHRGAASPLALRDDNVMALATDERRRVWIGTMSAGVEVIDPVHGEILHIANLPSDPASLPAAGIMSMFRDARGRIWVGTYGGGLARIDPDSNRVTRYPFGGEDSHSLSSDRATAIAEDHTGLIWVGTDGGGLNVLDPDSGRFAHFLHDSHDPASLSANTVYALHVDPKGAVWVGTRGGGLDRAVGAPFAKVPLRFENLAESDGLPNNTVYGVESDVSGNLWVSTNRGLAAVNPKDRGVRSFRRSHGLQGDEFNFGAHYRAPDGTLYFGGTNGYNAFLPERLQFNDQPPRVVLTDVLKLNTRASETPETLQDLDLSFRDASVTFRFAALDFTGPAENRYVYRLEGFDADWVKADASRQATYTNLAGGHYVFLVRAANSDGSWSKTPLSVRVRVSPPPWATWWARTLYAGLLCAVIYLLWRRQHRRAQREAAYSRRLEAEVDMRTRELAERNRDMERANRRLLEASIADALTGLGNRRCLHEHMALLGAQDGAAEGPPALRCVLMIVDLDHLKPINDQYGHAGGDAVLVQIAEILRRVFRSADLIVRWGGDEFVVMCADADLSIASALAERVRSSVAKQLFRVADTIVTRTSCSIGFAPVPFVPGHPELADWEQSLSCADAALYEAKRDRNTWVGWSGTEKAATLPSIIAAVEEDPAALEKDGYLTIRRRPWNPDDTVDRLRVLESPAR